MTVRHIEYVDDPLVSSVSNPLYVLLIAREVESDQSHLNDDGLTIAERELIKKRKEEEKMQKQVEADLGGFDVEQEWVEEIERENCFEIEKRFGGAPPIIGKTYEIWVRKIHVKNYFSLNESAHSCFLQNFSLLMGLIGKWLTLIS